MEKLWIMEKVTDTMSRPGRLVAACITGEFYLAAHFLTYSSNTTYCTMVRITNLRMRMPLSIRSFGTLPSYVV